MDYFRFLKKQQEERKLKEEKRLKAQKERKLKEQEKKRLNITKILIFPAQIIIATFLVLMIWYAIFYLYTL